MKVCIVGCGQAADYHLADWKRLPFTEILFVDKDIDKAYRFHDFFHKHGGTNAARTDCADTVPDDGRFDLGIICTLAGSHRELAEKFIRNGTPVFVEKPLALSWEDLDWFEEQERQGAWITTGFQIRWQPAVRKVLDFTKENHILHAQSWKHRFRTQDYYDPKIGRGTWHVDGGVIAQQAVHCVDLICALIPEDPMVVSMFGFNFKHDYIQCEDTAFMTLCWADKTATVNGTTAMSSDGDAGFRVVTSEGVVSAIGGAFNRIVEWPEDREIPETPSLGRLDMWTDVVARLQEGRPSPLPAKEAARSMRIVHAGYASAASDGIPVPYGRPFDLLGV